RSPPAWGAGLLRTPRLHASSCASSSCRRSAVYVTSRGDPRALENRYTGQPLALEELERRATAGRQVVDVRLQAELRKRGGRVAAAHDRESGRTGDGFGEDARAVRERLQLEGAHGAVPEHRTRTL